MGDIMNDYMSEETVGVLYTCFLSSRTNREWNRSKVFVGNGDGSELGGFCVSKLKALTNLLGEPPTDLEYGYYNTLEGVLYTL